jgi:hypothetical protein
MASKVKELQAQNVSQKRDIDNATRCVDREENRAGDWASRHERNAAVLEIQRRQRDERVAGGLSTQQEEDEKELAIVEKDKARRKQMLKESRQGVLDSLEPGKYRIGKSEAGDDEEEQVSVSSRDPEVRRAANFIEDVFDEGFVREALVSRLPRELTRDIAQGCHERTELETPDDTGGIRIRLDNAQGTRETIIVPRERISEADAIFKKEIEDAYLPNLERDGISNWGGLGVHGFPLLFPNGLARIPHNMTTVPSMTLLAATLTIDSAQPKSDLTAAYRTRLRPLNHDDTDEESGRGTDAPMYTAGTTDECTSDRSGDASFLQVEWDHLRATEEVPFVGAQVRRTRATPTDRLRMPDFDLGHIVRSTLLDVRNSAANLRLWHPDARQDIAQYLGLTRLTTLNRLIISPSVLAIAIQSLPAELYPRPILTWAPEGEQGQRISWDRPPQELAWHLIISGFPAITSASDESEDSENAPGAYDNSDSWQSDKFKTSRVATRGVQMEFYTMVDNLVHGRGNEAGDVELFGQVTRALALDRRPPTPAFTRTVLDLMRMCEADEHGRAANVDAVIALLGLDPQTTYAALAASLSTLTNVDSNPLVCKSATLVQLKKLRTAAPTYPLSWKATWGEDGDMMRTDTTTRESAGFMATAVFLIEMQGRPVQNLYTVTRIQQELDGQDLETIARTYAAAAIECALDYLRDEETDFDNPRFPTIQLARTLGFLVLFRDNIAGEDSYTVRNVMAKLLAQFGYLSLEDRTAIYNALWQGQAPTGTDTLASDSNVGPTIILNALGGERVYDLVDESGLHRDRQFYAQAVRYRQAEMRARVQRGEGGGQLPRSNLLPPGGRGTRSVQHPRTAQSQNGWAEETNRSRQAFEESTTWTTAAEDEAQRRRLRDKNEEIRLDAEMRREAIRVERESLYPAPRTAGARLDTGREIRGRNGDDGDKTEPEHGRTKRAKRKNVTPLFPQRHNPREDEPWGEGDQVEQWDADAALEYEQDTRDRSAKEARGRPPSRGKRPDAAAQTSRPEHRSNRQEGVSLDGDRRRTPAADKQHQRPPETGNERHRKGSSDRQDDDDGRKRHQTSEPPGGPSDRRGPPPTDKRQKQDGRSRCGLEEAARKQLPPDALERDSVDVIRSKDWHRKAYRLRDSPCSNQMGKFLEVFSTVDTYSNIRTGAIVYIPAIQPRHQRGIDNPNVMPLDQIEHVSVSKFEFTSVDRITGIASLEYRGCADTALDTKRRRAFSSVGAPATLRRQVTDLVWADKSDVKTRDRKQPTGSAPPEDPDTSPDDDDDSDDDTEDSDDADRDSSADSAVNLRYDDQDRDNKKKRGGGRDVQRKKDKKKPRRDNARDGGVRHDDNKSRHHQGNQRRTTAAGHYDSYTDDSDSGDGSPRSSGDRDDPFATPPERPKVRKNCILQADGRQIRVNKCSEQQVAYNHNIVATAVANREDMEETNIQSIKPDLGKFYTRILARVAGVKGRQFVILNKDTAIIKALAEASSGKGLLLRNLEFDVPENVLSERDGLKFEDFMRDSRRAPKLDDVKEVVSLLATLLGVIIDPEVKKAFDAYTLSLHDSADNDLDLFNHKYRMWKLFKVLKGARVVLMKHIKEGARSRDSAVACYANEVERGLREDMELKWDEETKVLKTLTLVYKHPIADILKAPKAKKGDDKASRSDSSSDDDTPPRKRVKPPTRAERNKRKRERAGNGDAAPAAPAGDGQKKAKPAPKERGGTGRDKNAPRISPLNGYKGDGEYVEECFAHISHNLKIRTMDCAGPPECTRTHATTAKPYSADKVMRAVRIMRKADPGETAKYKAALKTQLEANNPLFKA